MYTTRAPTPPSTPEPEAAWLEFRRILTTQAVENSRTSPERDLKFLGPLSDSDLYNRKWNLICVPADQIESSDSKWHNSDPKIIIAGKNEDDQSYEVVVHESYIQWLFFFGLGECFNYDPTAPTEEDVQVYGTLEATKRGHARFVRKAARRIRSGCCRGYEDCCRDLARLNDIEVPLERALLTYDILESDPSVRKHFSQRLAFLGANSQRNYNSRECLELLAKEQADFLQPIQECYIDPFRRLLEHTRPMKALQGSETQEISLVRGLLELSGGVVYHQQHAFDQEYTVGDNFDLCKALVGVTDTNPFGDIDPTEMYNILLKSKVFLNNTDISPLVMAVWSMEMMEFLPIGFPNGYLNLPSQVLKNLTTGEVDLVHIYFEHTFHRLPSLRKLENNILLLLVWSSTTHGRILQVLSEWASSGGTSKLFQRLKEDFRHPQSPEQLALVLAALICYTRLLPYSPNDITQPINGCYLADLNFLLRGISLSNQRTVFERIGFSLLRVFTTLGDGCEDIIQLLDGALDKDPPLLDALDGLTDQYIAKRITGRLSHLNAYIEIKGLRLIDKTLQLRVDNRYPSESIDKNLEDHRLKELPGKGLKDTRRTGAADTANTGEISYDWVKI